MEEDKNNTQEDRETYEEICRVVKLIQKHSGATPSIIKDDEGKLNRLRWHVGFVSLSDILFLASVARTVSDMKLKRSGTGIIVTIDVF